MENQNLRIRELKEQIQNLPKASNGKIKGIPFNMKEQIVSGFTGSQMSSQRYCTEIGISIVTFCKLRRELEAGQKKSAYKAEFGFQKIQVKSDSSPSVIKLEKNYILEGPRSLRIVGLTVAEIAELWRVLC